MSSMFIERRDFSTFHLGDNVYRLAGNLIPEIAERVGVPLGDEPNSQALLKLINKLEPLKALLEEIELPDREAAVELVERSGVQERLERSLWTPEIKPEDSTLIDSAILTGGAADWQDRSAGIAIASVLTPARIYIAIGDRMMDHPTERDNKNVRRLQELSGDYPTEDEYAVNVVVPRLVYDPIERTPTGKLVSFNSYRTNNEEEIARNFFTDNEHLVDQNLLFISVASTGIHFAVQMRRAAQALDPDFDSDPENPHVFILTDRFPLAQSEEQENHPELFQNACMALRHVAITALALHEAAGGE